MMKQEEQETIMEQEIDSLKACNDGRAGQIWPIRKKVLGDKKSKLVPRAIRNPKTEKLEVTKNNIKETVLNYCIDTLTSNIPKKDFNDEIEN